MILEREISNTADCIFESYYIFIINKRRVVKMKDIVKNTIGSLGKNKIPVQYFEDEEKAIDFLLQEIEPENSVGIGGSITIFDLGLHQILKDRGNKVYFHWLETKPEDADSTRLIASRADVYLTSTNALTEKGQLVNIDGIGNRVTSMIYGPKKVIIVCGTNKIVKTVDEAIERIKNNAYKNSRRLKLNTPCAITGKCNDCDSPQRMCSVTTIIERKPTKTDLRVVLIDKELGY